MKFIEALASVSFSKIILLSGSAVVDYVVITYNEIQQNTKFILMIINIYLTEAFLNYLGTK